MSRNKNQRGSVSLEQILFIGAVVLITGGISMFYTEIGDFFKGAGKTIATEADSDFFKMPSETQVVP